MCCCKTRVEKLERELAEVKATAEQTRQALPGEVIAALLEEIRRNTGIAREVLEAMRPSEVVEMGIRRTSGEDRRLTAAPLERA